MTSPACSVVVPAHQEEAVIERCLRALLDGSTPLEVVVVVNGSTDRTADLARAFEPPPHSTVTVVELAEGSKALALTEGDRHATTFPRLYVDADVDCSNHAVAAVCEAFATDDELAAAAPRLTYALEAVPWVVAAYSRVWLALHRTPWLIGSGVYALTRAGRERVGPFPRAIADDAYVRSRFAPGQRRAVDADFVAHPPRRLTDLVKRKSRVFLGHLELEQRGVVLELEHNTGVAGLLGRRDRPPLVEIAAYVAVTIVSKLRARTQLWLGRTDRWERDESSRVDE